MPATPGATRYDIDLGYDVVVPYGYALIVTPLLNEVTANNAASNITFPTSIYTCPGESVLGVSGNAIAQPMKIQGATSLINAAVLVAQNQPVAHGTLVKLADLSCKQTVLVAGSTVANT